jgi:hypothetical protein
MNEFNSTYLNGLNLLIVSKIIIHLKVNRFKSMNSQIETTGRNIAVRGSVPIGY